MRPDDGGDPGLLKRLADEISVGGGIFEQENLDVPVGSAGDHEEPRVERPFLNLKRANRPSPPYRSDPFGFLSQRGN